MMIKRELERDLSKKFIKRKEKWRIGSTVSSKENRQIAQKNLVESRNEPLQRQKVERQK